MRAGAQTDSVRVGGSLRMLEMIQGFQMASSPELASAINALLSDDATHMRMAPTRPANVRGLRARGRDREDRARRPLEVQRCESRGAKRIRKVPAVARGAVHFPLQQHRQCARNARTFDATKTGVAVVQEGRERRDEARRRDVCRDAERHTLPTSMRACQRASRTGTSTWISADRTPIRSALACKRSTAQHARWLAINTRQACTAAGGRFVPRIFGWMAHVYLFAGDDPKVIWGEEHTSMDVHMHHPPS
jgi:hypothetical protein